MIVICAEWFAIKDVEGLVGEGFMAYVTVEALSMIFTLQLPIRG
jgi:hypothetical protein